MADATPPSDIAAPAPFTGTPVEGAHAERLPRRLGAWSAAAVLISTIIGSGIFRVPRTVAAETGSVGGMLLCWVAGGIIALCGVLALSELATMYPRAGGIYVYLREAYGRLTAFLFGWTDLIALPAATAAIALVFAGYARTFAPMSDDDVRIVAAVLIVLIAALNYRSVRLAAVIQNVSTAGKILALLTLAASIFILGRGDGALSRPMQLAPRTVSGFGIALVAVLFSYDGWASFTSMAGEVRDPDRTLPRVLVGGLLTVIVVYLVVNLAYLHALTLPEIAVSPMVASDALQRTVGRAGSSIVAALVLLSTFGAVNSLTMSQPRIFFAMAEDDVFFRRLAAVHPRYRTPHLAILFATALSLFYVGFHTFEQLAERFVLATWPFYTLAVAAVFVLRRRRPDARRPYRTAGYPLAPTVFVLTALWIVGNALVKHPGSTLLIFAVVLLGWPLHRAWEAKRARERAR
ncbi:MAG TPA: amino acid permease [Gemmatimonadaceae bacterium]|nr:amino acid permease [Gemmatimonadaceae bacterium]